jgi:hypothetical protein
MKDTLTDLIKATHIEPAVPPELEHRVMLEVARRAIARARRRARLSLVASMSGVAMLLGACLTAIVMWLPTGFQAIPKIDLPALQFDKFATEVSETLPFLGQWGGVMVLTLFACGAVGFVYYLNGLFSESL